MADNDKNVVTLEEIFKVNEETRTVYGWAYVIEKDGQTVIDSDNDTIEENELTKAAHQFVLDERNGKVMHKGDVVADVVESLLFTKALQDALGIDLKKIGWFIGMKIRDDALWEQAKAGEFNGFSIGGQSRRVPIA